jgi:hypothetical protein
MSVRVVLELVNQMTAPARQAAKSLEGLTSAVRKLEAAGLRNARIAFPAFQKGIGNIARSVGRLSLLWGAASVTAIAFARNLARSGSIAQRAGAQLQAAYGGSLSSAERALESARRIAAETTVDFQALTSVMVRLKERGFDPLANLDLVRSIAQVSEVLDKPVEAIADQITRALQGGRAEGLKQLGIMVERSKKAGTQTISWADATGQLHKETVKLTDQLGAMAAITRALREKYPSNLDNTLFGQLDDIMDRWDGFVATINEGPKIKGVRQGGLLSWLTQQLREINQVLDAWQADGTLTRVANGVRTTIEGVLGSMKGFVLGLKSIYETITGREFTAETAGKGIAILGGALIALPTIWALSPAITGLAQIASGFAALAGIVGLPVVAGAIAAIGAALLVFNKDARSLAWDGVEGFVALIQRLAGLDAVAARLNEFSAAWIKTGTATGQPLKPTVAVSGIDEAVNAIQSLLAWWERAKAAIGSIVGSISITGSKPPTSGTDATGHASVPRDGSGIYSGAPSHRSPMPRIPLVKPQKTSAVNSTTVNVHSPITVNGVTDPEAIADKLGAKVKNALRRSLNDGAVVSA